MTRAESAGQGEKVDWIDLLLSVALVGVLTGWSVLSFAVLQSWLGETSTRWALAGGLTMLSLPLVIPASAIALWSVRGLDRTPARRGPP